ncbi:secreted aspartic proteinase precursor [Xylariaceae sp. FL0255]|nr:secreted aspartic proteinase precursor [Xylariaceae sp. FL0255]
MVGLTSVALLGAIAGISSAAPSPSTGSFSIQQVRNPNFKGTNPLAVHAKAFLKYGKPVPEGLASTLKAQKADYLAKRGVQGSVATNPTAGDEEWITAVQIGTPAQTLYLDFDSGSSDLWVFSTDTAKADVDGQTLYKPASSSTSKKLSGYTWEIEYGDGSSSSGIVYDDKVTIGGLTVATQAVESAEKVSSEFVEDPNSDGLLGLAFSSLNTVSPKQQLTWFDNIKSTLNAELFAVDFHSGAAGVFDFGYIDTTRYTGSISYASISESQGFWEFDASGYAVGSGSFVSTTIDGIADTGTTLVYLPDSVVSAYYKSVSGAKNSNTYGGYVFSCSATLPSFTFGVGSGRITIPASYINFGPVESGSSTCFGGIQSSDGIGLNIFGDVALKSAYVIFDASVPRIGWASKTLS